MEYMGPAGSGHYVKMIHNGIENGMLAAVCESWSLMHRCLGLDDDAIGRVFAGWTARGELRGTFLVQIGSEICARRKTRASGEKQPAHVLDEVLDKVVQV